MIANANWFPSNPLVIVPTLGNSNTVIFLPPDILFQSCGSVLVPDYIDFEDIEMIFYEDGVEEDGEEEEE